MGCTESESQPTTSSTGSVTASVASRETVVSSPRVENEGLKIATAVAALSSDPAKVMARAAGLTAEQARIAVPVGADVHADPKTWAPDASGESGIILITVDPPGGGQEVDYAAMMVREDGQWKVLATIPMRGGQ